MATKRQRGETSGTSTKYDKKRFTSASASDKYYNSLSSKTLIPERGLCPEVEDGELLQMIGGRRWANFTAQPDSSVVKIVKEFYANAKDHIGNMIWVRGKSVEVSFGSINAYYGLNTIPNNGFIQYLDHELDYSEVIQALCVPGTQWKLTDQQEAVLFPTSALSNYGKAWHAFICAKLMPCRHTSDVINRRAALLFCIAQGKSIDVGQVIHDSIDRAIKGGTSGGLPHPSLITGLCRQAGVKWDAEEATQPPLAAIDHSVIKKYKVWGGGTPHPRGLGFIIVPPEPADEPNQQSHDNPTTAAGSSGPPPNFFEDIRQELRNQTRRIDMVANQVQYGLNRVERNQDSLAQRQSEMYQNCSAAFLEMFDRMNPAGAPYQFPPLSAYPPADLPPEDEVDEEEEEDTDEE